MRYAKTLFFIWFAATCAAQSQGQTAPTPTPAANAPAAQSNEGFYPGWNLGVRFEGSHDSDGTLYDLGTGIGYNFSHHFGVGLGVPYYFVSSASTNTGGASGSGFGNPGVDLRWLYPKKSLTYASTVHLGAPTGDIKKGFSSGHATWNWSNHIEHGWDSFTPFIDVGVGNTIPDTRYFLRSFTSFGYNAQFGAGLEFDAGPFSVSGGAYDIAPWGNQTVYSKVFRCPVATKCGAAGSSTNRKGYTTNSVTTGGSSLTRDNGFNASAEFKPVKTVDFEVDYSRSIPLHLNTFSFGIALDLSAVLRGASLTR